jgi:hypothetical protein|uniref:Alginate and motility regulator n=1 Tax=Podoviridae sp. ctefc32 TaxID=2827742 RepID=A0A8S5T281_9CAUD|nr:MAG TPA: Alginate and motility regulator [Podoviridae sp. ctefc32]
MSTGVAEKNTKTKKTLAVRLINSELEKRVEDLAVSQNLSINMTINMLLGYAFNEIDRQNKKFTAKIIFESK